MDRAAKSDFRSYENRLKLREYIPILSPPMLSSHIAREQNPEMTSSGVCASLTSVAACRRMPADSRSACHTRSNKERHQMTRIMLLAALAISAAACSAPQPDRVAYNSAALVGPRGDTGPAGAQGPTGAVGAPGYALSGPAGEAGPPGPRGPQGNVGATGVLGGVVIGARGDTGPMGPAGAQGNVGDTGAQGLSAAGPAGPAGPPGPIGSQGYTGETGPQGATLVGPTGRTGLVGAAGTQGMSGQTGEQGVAVAGVAGYAGPSGLQGATGGPGPIGAQGAVGIVAYWTAYRDFHFDRRTSDLGSSEMGRISEIAGYLARNPSLEL